MVLFVFQYNETIDLSEFAVNQEWEITNTSAEIYTKYYACCQEPYQHLRCNLKLKRNSVYYTHVFIMPAVILALLVPFQFMLPPDCKERLTLGKTFLMHHTCSLQHRGFYHVFWEGNILSYTIVSCFKGKKSYPILLYNVFERKIY